MAHGMTAAAGWSTRSDAALAGKEAAHRAHEGMRLESPTLAVVFGSSWFAQDVLLQGIRSVIGSTPLVGGSTAGEITPEGPKHHSCVVLLLGGQALSCSTGIGKGAERSPREAGQQAAYLATKSQHGVPRIGTLLVGDGLSTNFSDVSRGVQEVVGTDTLVIGGLAGDDLRFVRTYQYESGRVLNRAVVGAVLGGTAKVSASIKHGFAPISRPREITAAHDNVLVELDHRPAASVYQEYFGPDQIERMRADGLAWQVSAYPLGIQGEEPNQWLLRNVMQVRDDGALACTGEIPLGRRLQLMFGNRELALEAARKAAEEAVRPLNQVEAVLVLDSVARKKLLGQQHAATEISTIQQTVGASVPMAGCYTYGEHGPLGSMSAHARSVTQTGSVLVIAFGT